MALQIFFALTAFLDLELHQVDIIEVYLIRRSR